MPPVERVFVRDPCPRVYLPGTLCDAQLFDGMRPPPGSHVLDYRHGPEPGLWWEAQLPALPGQFDCIGFSLGGIVAMDLLRRHPQRVRRLVLISSNADAAGPSQRERSARQLADFDQLGPRGLIEAQLAALQATGALGQAERQCLIDMAARTPRASLVAQATLNAERPDGHAVLAAWPGPLCLLAGQSDPWCGPAVQARMQATRPDAVCHLFAGVSHYTPLECPEALARQLDRFLND